MKAKKTGRPREFDKNEALSAAMHVFWKQGYDGASMRDLTAAMNISGPSLYGVFGDKRQLFMEAIDFYANRKACKPLEVFETEPNIETAVQKFFFEVIEYSTESVSGAKGCFLSSCVATAAGELEGVEELLKRAILDTDERLARRFELEKARGVLPDNFPSKIRARLMFDLRQGLVFRARAGIEPKFLLADIESNVRIILG
ncbi:TetR/AcrR family transcriptional regulator [Marinomonas sp. 15G1-11]|uniref:TetR/AcrR family transcriptional regulator n=1 Tax=Marinomonas phaeophyticola TaxID=3004091 RepID=A0ABT4JPE7_9GAMM|nr:TetR/AcrR family transcriptional regulator [Marinomonas sp. 15G1-11]MCZ2720248.1 TetR/AcrR family transcriptional regulator [Marinomonas sp. 15G1-11]